jgi:hypothetical protein
MHAATANKETCAYGRCCQPAVTRVVHRCENGETVVIGYCHHHGVKVLGYDPEEKLQ